MTIFSCLGSHYGCAAQLGTLISLISLEVFIEYLLHAKAMVWVQLQHFFLESKHASIRYYLWVNDRVLRMIGKASLENTLVMELGLGFKKKGHWVSYWRTTLTLKFESPEKPKSNKSTSHRNRLTTWYGYTTCVSWYCPRIQSRSQPTSLLPLWKKESISTFVCKQVGCFSAEPR